jgi:ferric-dicitrate binding protein FerR (iron transport regulator)
VTGSELELRRREELEAAVADDHRFERRLFARELAIVVAIAAVVVLRVLFL